MAHGKCSKPIIHRLNSHLTEIGSRLITGQKYKKAGAYLQNLVLNYFQLKLYKMLNYYQ